MLELSPTRLLIKELEKMRNAHGARQQQIRPRSFADHQVKGYHQGKSGAFDALVSILYDMKDENEGENIRHDQYEELLVKIARLTKRSQEQSNEQELLSDLHFLWKGQHEGRRDGYIDALAIITKWGF